MNSYRSSRGSIIVLSIIVTLLILIGGGYYYFFMGQKVGKNVVDHPTQNTTSQKVNIPTSAYSINMKSVSGKVMVTKEGGISRIVQAGDTISLPIVIQTSSGSEATILFTDKSLFRLGSNTTITLTEGKGGNIVATMNTGRLWGRVLGYAGGKLPLNISTGDTRSIVRGTAFELEKFPLFTKYTVLDSGATGSEIPGLDIIHSGSLYHILPEQLFTSDITNSVTTGSVNIGELFQKDIFALANTQKDILHMQDVLHTSSGLIDAEKITREITSSLPKTGSNELSSFVGEGMLNGLNPETGSGNDWERLINEALAMQSTSYNTYMSQYEAYATRVITDQQKLLEGIMKNQSTFLATNEANIKKLLKEQEVMIGNIMSETSTYLGQIQSDMDKLFAEQETMLNTILKDAFSQVNMEMSGMNIDMNQIMRDAMSEATSSMGKIDMDTIMTDSLSEVTGETSSDVTDMTEEDVPDNEEETEEDSEDAM